MSQFLTTHRLRLTPLSPIHIGCGEDFEPTNYVIEDGWLYGFDPSRAALNDAQRDKLMAVARRGSLPGIQAFFRDHAGAFKTHAYVVMPVCAGVAREYEKRIGKAANVEADGNQVFNKLEIERHVYTGALQQPFIPGSSFKGALRTAWLDDLNDKRKPHDVEFKRNGEAKSSAAMEKRLLQGDFQTSPLRLLKVADLMPTREPEREVLFAVNRKKQRVMKDGREAQPKGIAARKDCILPGQYRLFAADVTLPALLRQTGAVDGKGQALTPHAEQLTNQGSVDLKRLAQQSNTYHRQRLSQELAVLDGRGLVCPDWKRGIEALINELDQQLEAGSAFLVRLGRYGGADSKTLTGEGVASIKIMGARGSSPTFASTTKTVWLAAQVEDDQKHLIPFGWAVVEIDPQGDCAALQQWCREQSHGRLDMAEQRAQLQTLRQEAAAQKARMQAEAATRAEAVEAERIAAEQRAQALAKMTEQARQIEELRQACEDWAGKLPPHGNYKTQPADANKSGLYQDANRLVKTALQENSGWNANDKASLADMLEKCLPQAIAPWDAKEQRKKLQFAKLRGAA
ncbi:MAG: RAMP superfamily CRISPR-associated protein [Azonexus sp.]|jgi:CRISPR-associated protein Csm5|uniref:RAMP superfamily CRISPR-associated protein n=1 Tax=Azonexus sp. TaxID=1872668 RepID=UPI0028231D1A|nr:RAMP superfamily CRISPR-associated protein [Azonexus sp.]MDR0776283.1 RAMP superfamily CRISPR-associated protein [Azonexus sp.]